MIENYGYASDQTSSDSDDTKFIKEPPQLSTKRGVIHQSNFESWVLRNNKQVDTFSQPTSLQNNDFVELNIQDGSEDSALKVSSISEVSSSVVSSRIEIDEDSPQNPESQNNQIDGGIKTPFVLQYSEGKISQEFNEIGGNIMPVLSSPKLYQTNDKVDVMNPQNNRGEYFLPEKDNREVEVIENEMSPTNMPDLIKNKARKRVLKMSLQDKDYFKNIFVSENHHEKLQIDFGSPENVSQKTRGCVGIKFESLEKRSKELKKAFHFGGANISVRSCSNVVETSCEKIDLPLSPELNSQSSLTSNTKNLENVNSSMFERKLNNYNLNDKEIKCLLSPELKRTKQCKRKVHSDIHKSKKINHDDLNGGSISEPHKNGSKKYFLSPELKLKRHDGKHYFQIEDEKEENNYVDNETSRVEIDYENKMRIFTKSPFPVSPDLNDSSLKSKNHMLTNCCRRKLFSHTLTCNSSTEKNSETVFDTTNIDTSMINESVVNDEHLSPEMNKTSTFQHQKIKKRKLVPVGMSFESKEDLDRDELRNTESCQRNNSDYKGLQSLSPILSNKISSNESYLKSKKKNPKRNYFKTENQISFGCEDNIPLSSVESERCSTFPIVRQLLPVTDCDIEGDLANLKSRFSPELDGQSRFSPEFGGQSRFSPELGGQSKLSPELGGRIKSTPELSGRITSSPELGGQSRFSPELGGQLKFSPELSGQIKSSPELGGKSRFSPELGGQLKFSPELSGRIKSSPEHGGQSRFSPELGSQSRYSPKLGGQLKFSPELSGRIKSSPELGGQSRFSPELGGQSKFSPELGGQSCPLFMSSDDDDCNKGNLGKDMNKIFDFTRHESNSNSFVIESVLSQGEEEANKASSKKNNAFSPTIESVPSQTEDGVGKAPFEENYRTPEKEIEGRTISTNVALGSSSKKRKKKTYPEGSLISRFRVLKHRYESSLRVWKYEMKWCQQTMDTFDMPVFIMKSYLIEYGRTIMKCQVFDSNINPGNHRDFNIKQMYSLSNTFYILCDIKQDNCLRPNECFKIHPPWQILELQETNFLLLIGASRLETVRLQSDSLDPVIGWKRVNNTARRVVDLSCGCFTKGSEERNRCNYKLSANVLRDVLCPQPPKVENHENDDVDDNNHNADDRDIDCPVMENHLTNLYQGGFDNPDGLIGHCRVCRFLIPNFSIMGTIIGWDNYSMEKPHNIEGKYFILLSDSVGEVCVLSLLTEDDLLKWKANCNIDNLEILTLRKFKVTGFFFTHSIPVHKCWILKRRRIKLLTSQSFISFLTHNDVWDCVSI